jgi:hypothetical protein
MTNRKRFDRIDGKVIYFSIEPVTRNYPEGTQKVEMTLYPVGPGCYSSFIYTTESLAAIEAALPKIADLFLRDNSRSAGCREISDKISLYLDPLFPQRSAS